MSVRIMSLVFENETLTSTEKLIMLALADHANDEGKSIYPSQNRLSRKTGLARGTVNLHIGELIDQGYLKMVGYKIDRSNVLELEINVKKIATGGGVTENDTLPKGGVKQNDKGVSSTITGGVTENDTNHQLTIPQPSLKDITTTTTKPAAFLAYESNIGMITSFIADDLNDLVDTYTDSWVVDAIKVAVLSNVRKLKYVSAILSRWKVSGKDDGTKPQREYQGKQPAGPTGSEALLEEIRNGKF